MQRYVGKNENAIQLKIYKMYIRMYVSSVKSSVCVVCVVGTYFDICSYLCWSYQSIHQIGFCIKVKKIITVVLVKRLMTGSNYASD